MYRVKNMSLTGKYPKKKYNKASLKKPLLEVNKDIIRVLIKLKPKQRSGLIGVLKKKQIETICEIFLNFLKKNITTDLKVVKKLKKYKSLIKRVISKKTGVKAKRLILRSKRGGGVLSILLPLAASLIGSLVG